MKLTIETKEYATVSVSVDGDDMSLEELLNRLFKPALLALQYSPAHVEAINYEEPKDETHQTTDTAL